MAVRPSGRGPGSTIHPSPHVEFSAANIHVTVYFANVRLRYESNTRWSREEDQKTKFMNHRPLFRFVVHQKRRVQVHVQAIEISCKRIERQLN